MAHRFVAWLRSLFSGQEAGPIFLVDREGVCYPPERRVVLRANREAKGG